MENDLTVLQFVVAHRVEWVTQLMLLTTASAGMVATLIASLCIILILRLHRRHAAFAGFVGAVTGANLAVFFLKEWFSRLRPDTIYQIYPESGFSFPSGHTTNAVLLWGFAAYLVYHMLPRSWHVPIWAISIAVPIAVALSRVYLGVHYPSDVIAGLILGIVFLVPGLELAHRDFTYTRRTTRATWLDR